MSATQFFRTILAASLGVPLTLTAANSVLLGWNNLLITAPMRLQVAPTANRWTWTWPRYDGDGLLLWSPAVGPAAHWVVDTNGVTVGPDQVSVTAEHPGETRFYQLRKL